MEDEQKTREELIRELKEARRQIAQQPRKRRNASDEHTDTLDGLAIDDVENGAEVPRPLSPNGNTTETIDLSSLFTKDITVSGSFDIRGDIWKTTFGKVMQALPIPALLVDQGLKVTVANEAWGKVSPDYVGILGCSFSGLCENDSNAIRAQSLIRNVFADRKPRMAKALLKIGKNSIWGRMSFRSIRILNEQLILVLLEDLTPEKKQLELNRLQHEALQREIADRQVSEQAARESEARFRRIYEDAPMMMQAVDRHGTIQSVNKKWLETLGYTLDEVVGTKIDRIMSEACRKTIESLLGNLWKNGETHDVNCQFLKKDGTLVEVLADSSVTDDPVWGTVSLSTIRDVTHEIMLEKQLREAQKMEAVGTLAGGIAHDFNNLLQIVLGFSDLLLLRMDAQQPGHEELRSIREAARRGAELVNQILTFSRKVETNPRPINLNHAVEKIERLLSRTIPRMIHIEAIPAPDLVPVFADPGQMEQVLINLALNAKDAMPEGGRLTIQTRNVTLDEQFCKTYLEIRPGDYVLLTISDTGHGMEKAVSERIFEPFFTTKKPGEGTGLGLAIVFGIVKIHGGHIFCRSNPVEGTSFEIYFPAMVMPFGPESDTTAEFPAFGTETVLLVDDEELIRNFGVDLLSSAGYEVLTANDGQHAVDIYLRERDRISLVILDLVMPKMGGKQCLEKLLDINPNLKILIASGFLMDEETRDVLSAKARGIVKKPFKAKDLLKHVRSVLDKA